MCASESGADRERPDRDRQRSLLEQMLLLMQRQRQHLIGGDVKALAEINRLLGELVDRQKAMCQPPRAPDGVGEEQAAAELRRLARQLQEESHANYLLACRGAQFADFSLVLACGGDGVDGYSPRAPQASSRARIMDTRT